MTRISLSLTVLIALALALPLAGSALAQLPLADPEVEHEVLVDDLLSPTALDVADDGRVVIGHREGRVSVWEQDGTFTDAAFLPVDAYDRQGGQFDVSNCPRGDECPAGFNLAEGGIHGILLAPDFLESGEVYMYYTVPFSLGEEMWPPKMPGARPWCEGEGCPSAEPDGNDEGKWRLSRFTMDLQTNTIDLATELPLFENPAEWFYCCHYGGDLHWRADGTLLLSTGDDTTSDHSNGYSPHDQRPNWTFNNAALTSQNLADRRGKLLRIDVMDLEAGGDGIPGSREGIEPNPFVDDPDADPYVYARGFRNPYRFGYSPETDHAYVGVVGPDATFPDPQRGPAAHDEIETVPPGGGTNHGWPLCIADNIAYNEYDFQAGTAGEQFDCSGMTPASIYYTYTPSPLTSPYVQMQGGGNTALGGVAYHRPDSGALRLPASYDDTFLWMEYSRGALWRVPINADGSLDNSPLQLTSVLGGFAYLSPALRNPIDMRTGPDGAVYMIEANGSWNSTAGILSRVTCAGCAPDPGDYAGEVTVIDPTADVLTASFGGGLTQATPAWLAIGTALVSFAVIGFRRRRRIIS